MERGTRSRYYRAWRGVVTRLTPYNAADQGLPMDRSTLEVVTMEWPITGASDNTIHSMWYAVEDRHHMFGLRQPL